MADRCSYHHACYRAREAVAFWLTHAIEPREGTLEAHEDGYFFEYDGWLIVLTSAGRINSAATKLAN